jgi:hypothetical protein
MIYLCFSSPRPVRICFAAEPRATDFELKTYAPGRLITVRFERVEKAYFYGQNNLFDVNSHDKI